MTDIDIPDPIAASVLRYAEVLASEWHTMRGWLAGRAVAELSRPFGEPRVGKSLHVVPAISNDGLLSVPTVLTPSRIQKNLDEAADALYRLRMVHERLTPRRPIDVMRHITSIYVPEPLSDSPWLLAPADDEAGRMMARATVWLKDLPEGWQATDEEFEEAFGLFNGALVDLAKEGVVGEIAPMLLADLFMVRHPSQRAGVCSASLSHMFVSPSAVRDSITARDVLRGGIVHNGLYFDELVHAKWAADPKPLDDTKIFAPLPSFEGPMEFDTALQAAHVEYMRLRAQSVHESALATGEEFGAVVSVVDEVMSHSELMTEHGQELVLELRDLALSGASRI